jgi:predicted MFS family arabinose efflux permease
VRPFLEAVAHVNVSTLSSLLLIMGVAGLLGTCFIGVLLKTRLYGVLVAMPLAMALIAIGTVAALLAAWGLIGTAAPVGWWTWLSKVLPEDAERGGGLMVAIIQLAITVGATVGGFFYDASGYQSTFGVSATILCASALLAYTARLQAPELPGNEAVPEPPAGIHEKHSSWHAKGARELASGMGIVLRRNRPAIRPAHKVKR